MAEIFNVNSPDIACPIPDGTCLLAYRGSISHNLYVPQNDPKHIDDIDLIGVVLGPPECYLGLHEWGSRGTKEHKEGQYDAVFYEIRKAISLLLQGNPNIMSLLWLRPEDYITSNPWGWSLVENRHLFVGRHVYNAFAGYASAQLLKMETRDPAELREYMAVTYELDARGHHPNHKGEAMPYPDDHDCSVGEGKVAKEMSTDKLIARLRSYQKKGENIGYMGDKRKRLVLEVGFDAKNASHCIRLLRMAKEFLVSGEMKVYRTEDRDELLAIKRGEWSLAQVKQHAEELFAEVKSARDSSTLPEGPDRVGAEKLLVEILREHLSLAQDTRR